MRGCTEGRALNKAERMGINRARIVSAGRRTIEVRGRTPDGDRAYITLSKAIGGLRPFFCSLKTIHQAYC